MRCFGRTKNLKRCKKNCKRLFCKHHWLQPFLLLAGIGTAIIFGTDLFQAIGLKKPIDYLIQPEVKSDSIVNTASFRAIFPPNDSAHFNVLIIRFEDYIAGDDTYCIGRAIQEHLDVVQAQEALNLPLRIEYVPDSIPPPATKEKALNIQKRHHADLIIYGLAKNVQEGCSGAEVCFRYNIADHVVAQISPAIQLETTKHDQEYITTSPMELEKGILKINALSMKYWIKALISVKANKLDDAFLALTIIESDTLSLNKKQRAKKYSSIAKTYSELKQYDRVVFLLNNAIALDPKGAGAYYNRGIAYYYLKEYKRAVEDYDRTISLDPKSAGAYNNRGLAYYYLKEYKRAIEDYDRAIALAPEGASAYNNRGIAYYDLKEYKRAIEDYDRAIALAPEGASAYNNRGNAYTKPQEV